MVKARQGKIAIPRSVLHRKYFHPARFRSVASAVYRLRVQEKNLTNLVTYLLLHPKLQKHFKPRLDQKPCSIKDEVMAQCKEFLENLIYVDFTHLWYIMQYGNYNGRFMAIFISRIQPKFWIFPSIKSCLSIRECCQLTQADGKVKTSVLKVDCKRCICTTGLWEQHSKSWLHSCSWLPAICNLDFIVLYSLHDNTFLFGLLYTQSQWG